MCSVDPSLGHSMAQSRQDEVVELYLEMQSCGTLIVRFFPVLARGRVASDLVGVDSSTWSQLVDSDGILVAHDYI